MRVYADNRGQARPPRAGRRRGRRHPLQDRSISTSPWRRAQSRCQCRRHAGARPRHAALHPQILRRRARASRSQKSLEPQCLSGFRKDENYRILKSDVLIAVDAGDFIFYDCIYEELLQALGPINDDDSVPWTMFNDDVQKGFFDIYDQYLLNILYHPRIRAGMTNDEVRALLPEILPEIRVRREDEWAEGVSSLSSHCSARLGNPVCHPRIWAVARAQVAQRCEHATRLQAPSANRRSCAAPGTASSDAIPESRHSGSWDFWRAGSKA